MKKISLIIFLGAFLSASLNAETNTYLNEFRGGSFDVRVEFAMDALYGSRGDGLRAGGTVSTLDFHQSLGSYNPACLAFQKKSTVAMSMFPFEVINTPLINNFLGLSMDDVFKDAINSFEDGTTSIERMFVDSFEMTLNASAEITDLNVYAGQVHRITGFEAITPFAHGQAAVAVAREEKFSFEIDMLMNSLEFLINMQDDEDPAYNINIRAAADLALNLNTKQVVTSFGMGRQITPLWGVGAVLEKHDSMFKANGRGAANATITSSMSPDMVEYNTEPGNSLQQQAVVDLVSEAWGLRVGTAVHAPGDTAEIAIDFAVEPEMKYRGCIDIVYRYPDGDEIFNDFLAGEASTIEERVDEAEGDFYVKLPSYMRISAAWKPGPVVAINYTHYFDPLYFKFVSDEVEGEIFLNMMDAFRLGFNFEWFQIGGGLILANEGIETFDKESGEHEKEVKWYPIPVFSMGSVIPVGDNIRVELELMSVSLPVTDIEGGPGVIPFPLPALKGAVTYMF